jgi:hypothetical protein
MKVTRIKATPVNIPLEIPFLLLNYPFNLLPVSFNASAPA